MKYIVVILSILVLLGSTPISAFLQYSKPAQSTDFFPQDITLSDDAYHGYRDHPCMEWWYFDASCDNGYSLQVGISVVGMLGIGVVFERLTIYKNTDVIKRNAEYYLITDVVMSPDVPFVAIQGRTILTGITNTTTGNLEYTVSLDFSDCAVDLHYTGCTQGWKAQHNSKDWWGVFLPLAEVTGSIIVDTDMINVTGTGYHDHNWDVTGQTYLKHGWFWGKFSSPGYTVIWAVDLPTRTTYQPIVVVNKNNAGYTGVPPEMISFSTEDFRLNHLKWIPYYLTIKTTADNVYLVVNMDVVNVDFQSVLTFIHYWRYHVKCTGDIMINGEVETIDGVFIAEFGQLL
jgi:hypothetical protein